MPGSLLMVPKLVVDLSNRGLGQRLASMISKRLPNFGRLLVVFEGFVRLTNGNQLHSQVSQGNRFKIAVSTRTQETNRFSEVVYCFLIVSGRPLFETDVNESTGLALDITSGPI